MMRGQWRYFFLQGSIAGLLALANSYRIPVHVPPQWVRLKSLHPPFTLIDPRAAPDYQSGHLPGALNLSARDASLGWIPENYLDLRAMPRVVVCSGPKARMEARLVATALARRRGDQVLVAIDALGTP